MTRSKKIVVSVLFLLLIVALTAMLWATFVYSDSSTQAMAAEVNHTPTNKTTHTNHDGWTVLTADIGSYLSSGNYYLDSDVTLNAPLAISGTVTLCFNGHILRSTMQIEVSQGGSLTLEDCNTSITHRYYADDANNGVYVIEGAADFDAGYAAATTKGTIAGGILTGATGSYPPITVFTSMTSTSMLTINGGAIAGNHAEYNVLIMKSSFVMNGGAIIGNTSTSGGGVTVLDTSTFTMEDGVIAYNTAMSYGGGVFVDTAGNSLSATFTMNGGTISNNTIAGSDTIGGAGVYLADNAGTFTLRGGTISGNVYADGIGGVGIGKESKFVMNGGSIESNTGLSLYFNENSTGEINDGFIINNDYAAAPATIMLNKATLHIKGGSITGNYSSDSYSPKTIAVSSSTSTLIMEGGELTPAYTTAEQDYGGYAVQVMAGTFTLKDGVIHNENNTNTGIACSAIDGTINIKGGEVYGMNANVFEVTRSQMTISGGYIHDNKLENAGGAKGLIIRTTDVGNTINMSGGTISDNNINGGAMIYIGSGTTFTMSGGTISNNTVTMKGGAFYNEDTLTITGGTISGNTAPQGSVVYNSGTLTIDDGYFDGDLYNEGSGSIVVNGGYFSDYNMRQYMAADLAIYYISASADTQYKQGFPYAVKDASYHSTYKTYIDTLSRSHDGSNHDGWLAFTSELVTELGGNLFNAPYYLEQDVAVANTITVDGTLIALCLNSHILSSSGNSNMISVTNAANFYLLDCNSQSLSHRYCKPKNSSRYLIEGVAENFDTEYANATKTGEIQGGILVPAKSKLRAINVEGADTTFTMLSGSISGVLYTYNNGGGVYVKNSATFNMEGGSIIGNAILYGEGGGVHIYNATFVMNGGQIVGNTCVGNGGGLSAVNSNVTINKGLFTENYGPSSGSALLAQNSTVNIYQATFTNNVCDSLGTILLKGDSCVFTIYDGCVISDNTVENAVVYVLDNAKCNMKGGTIASNTATSGDKLNSVYTETNGTFTMDNGYVDGLLQSEGGTILLNNGYFGNANVPQQYWAVNTSMYYVTTSIDDQYKEGFPFALKDSAFDSTYKAYLNNLLETHDGSNHDGWLELTDQLVVDMSGQFAVNAPYYLNTDVTLSNNIVFACSALLDLNGHALVGVEYSDPTQWTVVAQGKADQNLTILDCVGTGSIVNGVYNNVTSVGDTHTLTLLGGTIDKIAGSQYDDCMIVDGATVQYVDLSTTTGKVQLSSGTLQQVDIATGSHLQVGGGEIQSVTNHGEITLTTSASGQIVSDGTIHIADNVQLTLIEGSDVGGTVDMMADSCVVNINGGTMSVGVSRGTINVNQGGAVSNNVSVINGTFNVKGGTVASQVEVQGGTVNVDSGTVDSIVATSGTLAINGGQVNSLTTSTAITVSGGTVSAATAQSGAEINVVADAKATIQSLELQSGATATVEQSATLSLQQPVVTDANSITVSGNLVVTDVDITTKVQGTGTVTLSNGASLVVSDGDTIAYSVVLDGTGQLVVNGGKFGGQLSATDNFNGTPAITGGNFAHDIDDKFLSEGHSLVLLVDTDDGYDAQYPYSVFALEQSGAITSITVTWNNNKFVYDGASLVDGEDFVPTFTDQNGDPLTVRYQFEGYTYQSGSATLDGLPTDAGAYNVTVKLLIFDATAATSYYTSGTITIEVAQRTVTLQWGNTQFTYNGTKQAPQADATGVVAGDDLGLVVSQGNINAGNYTATATISNPNYEVTNTTVDYVINKKQVSVVWSNTSQQYTGSTLLPTATVDTGIEGETLTLTVSGGGVNVGTYTATATCDNANYELLNATVEFTIVEAPAFGIFEIVTVSVAAFLILLALIIFGATKAWIRRYTVRVSK